MAIDKSALLHRAIIRVRAKDPQNMVDNLSDEQLDDSLESAIGSFNLVSPITNLDFEQITNHVATTELLIEWTTYWIIFNFYSAWVGIGQELSIEDLTAIDRLDRYRDLLDKIFDDLNDRTAKAKADLRLSPSLVGTSRVFGYRKNRTYPLKKSSRLSRLLGK